MAYSDANSAFPVPVRNGSGTSTVSVLATGDQDIDGLLIGTAWATTSLSFSFPTSGSQYGSYGAETSTFQSLTSQMQTAVRSALAQFEAVSNLSFTENTASPGSATLRFGMSDEAQPTAYAYYPSAHYAGGDVWFGTQTGSSEMRFPTKGNYAYHSTLHEIGHALGLKHGQESGGPGNTAMTYEHDSMEFSVMTYRSYVGNSGTGYTNGSWDYAQTLMMYDIAAIQEMYGADFTTNAGNSVYTFSTSTGEMFINGVGQGAPGGNRVFLTVWDGGGTDTYDFSNYTTNQSISLAAGGWSLMSSAQQAYLGDGNYARGNLFNALQYNGDTRSLIENAIGGSGNDTMVGNAVANILDGRAGADLMSGVGGNDIYGVDNIGDIVDESLAGSNGSDRVNASISFSLSDTVHVKGYVEHIVLTGTAAINATGNSLANTLIGNAAANTLNGAAGADHMAGAGGSDIYVVDNVGDIVDESLAGSNGGDRVSASISFNLSDTAHVKGAVEHVVLIGTAAINATGNALANMLIGNAAANTLNGAAGADHMSGVGGSDIYVVDNVGDIVDESLAGSNGGDRVSASISFNLSDTAHVKGAVEHVVLIGTAAINAAGNTLANTLIGNAAANILNGRTGNDALTGGAGKDVFAFTTTLNATTNVDTIKDFSVVDDTVWLDDTIFTAAGAIGALASDAFYIGAAAHDANDRIIYDSTTGALMYDFNGSGAGGAIRFAQLGTGLALTAGDFQIG